MKIPATLRALCQRVRPPRAADARAVRRHLDALTKPPGSLGRLEDLALRLALIYGDPPTCLGRRTVFLLAADHGVAGRGVSAYPAEVTAQMCRNFAAGGAAICAIARSVGAEVVTVDIGVDADLSAVPGILVQKIRRGTRDLSAEPAMTAEEAVAAIQVGVDLVAGHAPAPDVVVLGDMGIGNTTAASAVTAALLDRPAEAVVGFGTGINAEGLARKREIIERAVQRLLGTTDPVQVLAEVGGLEIAGLAGVALGSAALGRGVITDGFIATAAALVAVRICPATLGYLFASHCSVEPGHALQLRALGLDALFALDLRLGEGTGGALALPLLEAAGAILRDMATFEAAGVTRA